MKTIAWLTDIHLNFLNDYQSWWSNILIKSDVDSFIITGDLTENKELFSTLKNLGQSDKKVYYVLGNHDYYCGSIEKTRDELSKGDIANTVYLGTNELIRLSDATILIGDDGWYDGRFGWYWRTKIKMNDFRYIKEFEGRSKSDRLMIMQRYTDRSANRILDLCQKACKENIEELYIATHVPPFKEASVYNNQISDEFHLPFYANYTVGITIKNGTEEFRKNGGQVTVLCGHTHGRNVAQIDKGLAVKTGQSDYGYPQINEILNIK